jgi:tetratricopeptide (TPR) repeat protein
MTPGRNDPCPCGSGRKYKHCCGLLAAAEGAVPARGASPPGEPQGLIDAANRFRARGRPREAVPLYRRALEIDPHSAEAHNNLGNAFLELGQPQEAADCYRRALTVKAGSAEILCNLANALWQLGQQPEALNATERALALDPHSSMAHNILGLLRAASGQRAEAVASYRRSLALNPRYVEALNNLGNVLRDLGQRHEALPCYRRAIELDPQRADSHYNLGNTLFELRRLEEAAVSFRRAIALQPAYPQAHLGLAAVLRVQGGPSEAEASTRAALAIDANCVEALTLLAELSADRGQFAAAQQLFERALVLDPASSVAYCGIAAHRRMSHEDVAWLRGVEGLLAKPLPLGQEISLHYALGKYFDDVGRYDEAFASYRQANELSKRYGAHYHRAKLTRRIDRAIAGFDAAYLRRCHTRACDSQLPVFIVGMPRSGTSLTEQILASHPSVFGAGEVRFWDDAFGAMEKAGLGSESAASLIPQMARDYLGRVTAISAGAPRVTDKMPANFLYAGLIHAVFPRARIIHMQRHPLDTCLSIYFQNFFNMARYGNDLTDLAHYYGEYLRITDHWRALLPAEALLEVPYEALLEDQAGWTHRLLEFIGLPWDARCLDFHRTERVVITASRWQVRQKLTRASVGRWHHYEKHLAPLRQLVSPVSASAATPEEPPREPEGNSPVTGAAAPRQGREIL